LEDDDRYFRRFIFRFEFLNPTIEQPASNFKALHNYAVAIKKHHGKRHKIKNLVSTAQSLFSSQEEHRELLRMREKNTVDMHEAYHGAIGELLSDATKVADEFVKVVNQHPRDPREETAESLRDESHTGTRVRPPQSFGPGYENCELTDTMFPSRQINDGNEEYSSGGDDDSDSSDEVSNSSHPDLSQNTTTQSA